MKVTKGNLIKSWNAERGFSNPQLFIKAYHLAEETSLAVKTVQYFMVKRGVSTDKRIDFSNSIS